MNQSRVCKFKSNALVMKPNRSEYKIRILNVRTNYEFYGQTKIKFSM